MSLRPRALGVTRPDGRPPEPEGQWGSGIPHDGTAREGDSFDSVTGPEGGAVVSRTDDRPPVRLDSGGPVFFTQEREMGEIEDMAARLAAAEKERDSLRERLDAIESWGVSNPGDIMRVADGWRGMVAAAEARAEKAERETTAALAWFKDSETRLNAAEAALAAAKTAAAATEEARREAETALASERAARVAAERERGEARKERDAAGVRASELGDALAQALEQKVPDVRALRGAAFQQFWAWQEVSGHIPAGTSLYVEVEACIEEAFRLGAIAAESSLSRAVEALRRIGRTVNAAGRAMCCVHYLPVEDCPPDCNGRIARAVLAEVGK